MLRTLYPHRCDDHHSSHIAFSLARYLAPTDLRAELWVATCGPRGHAKFVRTAVPESVRRPLGLLNRMIWPRSNWTKNVFEYRCVRAFRDGDVAHVYRGCSLELMQALRARGHVVFLERWGTMDHAVKRVTDEAFARAGWPFEYYTYLQSQEQLERDQAETEAADFIFSPGPPVTDSLLERGIPEARILKTSYGWDPERFTATTRALPRIRGVTVLFVGRVGVSKGAHLLLNAWSRAGIDGRLVLLGEMEPMIPKYCGDHLHRPDVIHLPYTRDPGPVYRSADVFALPTLTEGSPLVCYEAMGSGLPLVVSPPAAGIIVRHGKEGFVIDPYDQDAWVTTLQDMAADAEMRRAMGDSGRIRAAGFTWEKVAARRYELIKDALSRFRRVSDARLIR